MSCKKCDHRNPNPGKKFTEMDKAVKKIKKRSGKK